MELRYLLCVVTEAGSEPHRSVAVALSRAGCAVLCVDGELEAAETTAAAVRRGRVAAWALGAAMLDELDARLVAARARDLGGADLLVTAPGAPGDLLADLVRAEALERERRRPGTPVVDRPGTGGTRDPADVARDVVRRLAGGR